MERLNGPTCLQAVCHRFSNGVEVVKCVSGFIKEVGETEQSYSSSLEKLVRSPLYNFHSNFLTQLLGSTPYKEMGTVKHTWDKLGEELNILAKLHAEKAQAYQDTVRKPLIELVPRLEEKRRELKNRARQLRAELDVAEAKHLKEKSTYQRMAGNVDRSQVKLAGVKPSNANGPKAYMSLRNEAKQEVKRAELNVQENVYRETHRKHMEARENFDKEAMDLYKEIQELESERVNTVKTCLKGFTSTLSNTAPAYLETMQRMTVSVDEISAASDIKAFVEQELQELEQEEEVKGSVPALDLRPSTHAVDSPTSAHHNGHLPVSSRRSSREEEEEKEVKETEKENNNNKKDKVKETEMKEEKLKASSSPRAPLTGPREERVSVTQDSPPAAPPLNAWSGGMADTHQPPTKSRRKPPVQTKPAPPDPAHATNTSPATPPKPRPQVTSRTGSSQLPNGHVHSRPAAGVPESWNDHEGPSKAKKVSSPKTSRRTARKPTPWVQQNGHSPSSSQPSVSPPSENDSRPPKPSQVSRQQEEEVRLLTKLTARAQTNDYYRLLGAEPGSTSEELAKARRERSRELHPDHCANAEQQRMRNEEKLTHINHAYQLVLQNESARESYNLLCAFRKRYAHILQQDKKKLEVAERRLTELRTRLKKGRVPEALTQEVDCALNLIQTRMTHLQHQE